ncbi:SPOR domain-containing protein [Rhizorhabdus histidinilytica]|uniref:Sporulation related domain-containing protein n=1 Tax=Rhizorhabdus histidinilytica TaxID=439228 RepID=A0A1T5B1Q2_9SPHN|nr:SPOR domain-containing protein [Rhizorhabdus histidinilytica]SKB40900.1 Sporulation related domain-containing protein [Rhizorhabdus histidinilytica]
MTDYSRDRLGPQDEDRLPWLEPVEEEYEEGGVGTGRLIVWLVAALMLLALVVGGYFWLRGNDKATSGEGALIKAPDSYYKERPGETAAPIGEDEIVYSASKGNEVESVIDTSGAAETPVNIDRPRPEAPIATTAIPPSTSAPAARPAPATAKPAAPKPTPTVDQALARQATKPAEPKPAPRPVTSASAAEPASGGSMVQLGAFSSQAKANAAWKTLSGRFSFLSGLTQSVVPVQSGDKTLYRLRASGGNAGDICRRLKTAGESCSVIG